MIDEAKIAEIRARASIVEVISDYLALRKAGRNHIGLCPFHAEKTPSFTVNEEKGIFHCFGCHVGGNVFSFLMQYERLSFPEAVERVGKRYGIVVERADKAQGSKKTGEREALYQVNERAARFFRDVLLRHPEGRKGLEYLKRRGVEMSVAERFFLGYAPQSGRALAEELKREGCSLRDAARAGLVSESRGGFSDKFFGRLMFPILDVSGRVVAFGGRVIGAGLPKYLNCAETPLFRKGSTLYGLFHAKEAIRREDRVVIVEGYLDAIALHQYGVSSVVATLGTALTADHVRVLGRYTKNIIALFDGDGAGRKAAARSFEIFVEGGVFGKSAFLPSGEDPDTFVRRRGKDAVEALLGRAQPLADYFLTWLEGQYGKSLAARSQIAQEVSRLLAKVRNPLEADLLARRASDLLGIREELLRSSRALSGPQAAARARSGREVAQIGLQPDRAERALVSLVLRFPSIAERVAGEKDVPALFAGQWRDVIDRALSLWRAQGAIDPAALVEQLAPQAAAQVSGLFLAAEAVEEEAEKMASDCLAHLRRRHLRSLQMEARRAIRAAEENHDEKVRKERILEWQEIAKRKDLIERSEA
ncbi:MAG TPA: DNA primase [Candidatus Acidoferrales bacterium]|nr:DNA primase [Candidatus Acidoferrales bacterium]